MRDNLPPPLPLHLQHEEARHQDEWRIGTSRAPSSPLASTPRRAAGTPVSTSSSTATAPNSGAYWGDPSSSFAAGDTSNEDVSLLTTPLDLDRQLSSVSSADAMRAANKRVDVCRAKVEELKALVERHHENGEEIWAMITGGRKGDLALSVRSTVLVRSSCAALQNLREAQAHLVATRRAPKTSHSNPEVLHATYISTDGGAPLDRQLGVSSAAAMRAANKQVDVCRAKVEELKVLVERHHEHGEEIWATIVGGRESNAALQGILKDRWRYVRCSCEALRNLRVAQEHLLAISRALRLDHDSGEYTYTYAGGIGEEGASMVGIGTADEEGAYHTYVYQARSDVDLDVGNNQRGGSGGGVGSTCPRARGSGGTRTCKSGGVGDVSFSESISIVGESALCQRLDQLTQVRFEMYSILYSYSCSVRL